MVKVNGETVDTRNDRNLYFTLPSRDKELLLTFTRGGQMFDVKIHPQSTLQTNLYDEWIDNNQKYVDEKGKGRIAYGYMKNMGQGELEQFIIDMTKELNSKDALIFDLRFGYVTFSFIKCGDNHACALASKTHGDALTDTLTCTCYDGHLIL